MGYPDGYYYGQGRIICDTSTFSVGDTIRVRSVYNALQTEDKQVVTVGTPLIFTVPPYDYYKICRVQTINDTPTEVGGEYVEIGFGDLHRSNVLDKTTLGGIQGILNAHQESSQLAIGDEVDIIVNGSLWTMQIAGINIYNSHEVIFTSKKVWTLSTTTNYYSSSLNPVKQAVDNFYANIDNKDRQYIKEVTRLCKQADGVKSYDDYCYVLGVHETQGETYVGAQIQMPLFVTQANRIKTYNGSVQRYWTSDWRDSNNTLVISTSGTLDYVLNSNNEGVVPSFTLLADS